MIRYKSSRQLSISEFKMPFEAKSDENNRGVIFLKNSSMGKEFARLYLKNFKATGVPLPKDARLEGVIIKHIKAKTDEIAG